MYDLIVLIVEYNIIIDFKNKYLYGFIWLVGGFICLVIYEIFCVI